MFKFTEAISLHVYCHSTTRTSSTTTGISSQPADPPRERRVRLAEGQIRPFLARVVPKAMEEMLKDHESPRAERAMEAMLRMKKIDIGELQRAYAA